MVMPASLQAWGVVLLLPMLTSICRSKVTICSGLYLWIAMTGFLLGGFSHSTWYKNCRSRQLRPLLTRRSYNFALLVPQESPDGMSNLQREHGRKSRERGSGLVLLPTVPIQLSVARRRRL